VTAAGDRLEIEWLVRAYSTAVDARDTASIAACFTDDARLEYFGGATIVTGRAGISAFFDFAGQAAAGHPVPIHSTHFTQIDDVRLADDGASAVVSVSCLVTFVYPDGGGELLLRGVAYSDVAVRTEQGWRLSSRRHRQLWEHRGPVTLLGLQERIA